MNSKGVTVVRVYLHESESLPQRLLDYLHDEAGVRGVTVFRGVTGFGASGNSIPPGCWTCRWTCRW